jgi:AMIN domain-containing protein
VRSTIKITVKRALVSALVVCCGCLYAAASPAKAAPGARGTVRHVAVLGGGNQVEIEIAGSQALTPKAQIISNPERLVVDFPGIVPGSDLHNIAVNRGDVKAVRVGLFTANPPVTRIVVDLNSPSPYQLFPSGRSVIVKIGNVNVSGLRHDGVTDNGPVPPGVASYGNSARSINMGISSTHSFPTSAPAIQTASAPGFEVTYQNGLLTIRAQKATLGQVLAEVQRKTGADITIPPEAQQEKIVTDIGPATPSVALASLLDGSNFDYILVGSERDPNQLRSAFLTPRGGTVPDSQINPAVVSPPAESASPVTTEEPQQFPPDNTATPDMEPPPPPDPPEPPQ